MTTDTPHRGHTERDPFLTDTFAETWAAFCDADPVDPEFADKAEAAGLIELVPVTKEAAESSFAAECGIERGGMMWVLTQQGRDRIGQSLRGQS